MCGIWGYIGLNDLYSTGNYLRSENLIKLFEAFNKVRERGPDRSEFKIINKLNDTNDVLKAYLGFHRLAIMDKSTYGDQPFTKEIVTKKNDQKTIENNDQSTNTSIYCMCNGEIYNYKELVKNDDLSSLLKSNSDCEIIPHLYTKYGFTKMLEMLRSESAICVLEINRVDKKIKLMLGRDHLGVRPLFVGMDSKGIAFSSILKGVVGLVDHKSVRQLNSAEALCIEIDMNNENLLTKHSSIYYDLNTHLISKPKSTLKPKPKSTLKPTSKPSLQQIFKSVHDKFIEAVEIRLESDRPIGALLSGGLDSSLVVSIASSYLRKRGKTLRTFSIGIPGSTDKDFAELVAKHCGTDHTHVEFSEQDFLAAIEDVIIATETYDITTVRASVGQYLIAKWIRDNTDIRVLLNGDGSDELTSGYMYFHNSPNPYESHAENIRLLKELPFYDVLRVDRCIAHNGIEARVPFLDHEFVDLYLSIDPKYRVPLHENKNSTQTDMNHLLSRKIEKWLLRKSFDQRLSTIDNINENDSKNVLPYLPAEVLWRKKEAFSDGVSSQNKSWYQIIQESLEKTYEMKDLESDDVTYHIKPHTFEALHYRKLFNKHFCTSLAHVIPHYWLPKWCGDIKEPSARVLKVY
jgi:asparagine synthase (glutamine-hydrolysing)